MPASPKWATLPKRRCSDCGKLYKPYRPPLEGELTFCSANCRKSYHKHGGAYRKLKVEVQKMVTREIAQAIGQLRQIVREELRAVTRYDSAVDDLVIADHLLNPAPFPSPSRPK